MFVLTHEKRDPWVRPGGTTFYFVDEGPAKALALAREAAGARDVRISGGANAVAQYVNAGLVDELTLSLAPILLGKGLRLFDAIGPRPMKLVRTMGSPTVTHLTCAFSG